MYLLPIELIKLNKTIMHTKERSPYLMSDFKEVVQRVAFVLVGSSKLSCGNQNFST